MLQALFSTPTGRKTRVMRVRRSARSAGALAHLLAELGFTATRETDRETLFVRVAPAAATRSSVAAPTASSRPRRPTPLAVGSWPRLRPFETASRV